MMKRQVDEQTLDLREERGCVGRTLHLMSELPQKNETASSQAAKRATPLAHWLTGIEWGTDQQIPR
jgi:hypothetical protein